MIAITLAKTPEDIQGILELQSANIKQVLSEEELSQEGFVTVKHTEALLKQMMDYAPQVIALDDGLIAGYVLAMDKRMAPHIPELQAMFAVLDTLPFQEGVVSDYPFIVCGQACVHKDYRGRALLDRMYFKMKELFSATHRFCITEIAVGNTRSQRVHERVGFKTIHRYRDAFEQWTVVQWKW
ncbi:MAG: GNAT family N-acetyltransferase [Flavihumibacter sp.]